MRVLGVYGKVDEAVKVWREYFSSTGNYATIWRRVDMEGGKKVIRYEVRAYDEPCLLGRYVNPSTLHHMDLRMLAAEYLRARKYVQQSKQILSDMPLATTVREILDEAESGKKKLLYEAEKIVSNHPVYEWCRIVKAGKGWLGPSTAMIYIGYIDPHECTTVGKAWKYWGLTPEGKRVRGRKAAGRMELKGVAMFTAKQVVMGRDPYYRPLKEAKKKYYLDKLPEDLKGRLAVANEKADYWLAKLLLGHAWEVYRRSENLPIHPHRNYIPPKSDPDQEPDPKIIERLEQGRLE